MNLTSIDWIIMLVYFAFVLGIGFLLKRSVKTSTDFFLAGRAIPAWICGLAFISANLGAQEVIGMAASGAKYGIATSHFYWIGAIPAMVFVGDLHDAVLLRLAGALGAGISAAALRRKDARAERHLLRHHDRVFLRHFDVRHGEADSDAAHSRCACSEAWDCRRHGVFMSASSFRRSIVLAYIFLGGLTSAIYNEVLQFFLIVAGFFPLVLLGLKNVGGWSGLKQQTSRSVHPLLAGHGQPTHQPAGRGVVRPRDGIGLCLSFGYWCTDFLVVQRAMAADSMSAARRTPLIAALPKMLFPFLVILPGLIAISLPAQRPLFVPTCDRGVDAMHGEIAMAAGA